MNPLFIAERNPLTFQESSFIAGGDQTATVLRLGGGLATPPGDLRKVARIGLSRRVAMATNFRRSLVIFA